MKIIFTYFLLFIGIFSLLTFIPKTGGYIWQPELINTVSALLLTLLVFLVGQISGTSATHTGIIGTAIFTLLFCPNSYMFFSRDEQAVIELISVCIVPFFISQYHRIESKNFKYGYFIMLMLWNVAALAVLFAATCNAKLLCFWPVLAGVRFILKISDIVCSLKFFFFSCVFAAVTALIFEILTAALFFLIYFDLYSKSANVFIAADRELLKDVSLPLAAAVLAVGALQALIAGVLLF